MFFLRHQMSSRHNRRPHTDNWLHCLNRKVNNDVFFNNPTPSVELNSSLWLSVSNQFWVWIFKLSRKSGGEVSFLDTLKLKMGPLRLFDTSLTIYRPTMHNILQYLNFHQHGHHDTKSRTFLNLSKSRRISNWTLNIARFSSIDGAHRNSDSCSPKYKPSHPWEPLPPSEAHTDLTGLLISHQGPIIKCKSKSHLCRALIFFEFSIVSEHALLISFLAT
jgi:hypothetical protein